MIPAFEFPKNFLWGTATSAHQVEGNNTNNDWWAWEQAGRVKEPSGLACDHYHRFREDFELAVRLCHNAHRFSIEWSRVEPREGEFDETAIAHYQDVVRVLQEQGLEPIVTLHHYTNPLWLAAKGGWTNPKVVDYFARYSQRLAEALGDGVRFWLTINEPMVYAVMHYIDGVGPPGEQNLRLAFRAIEHLVRAHAASYHALHAVARANGRSVQVSLAKHVPIFVACHPFSLLDQRAARATDQVYNKAFLESCLWGRWRVAGAFDLAIPEAKGTLDFIGMNYYAREFIRFGGFRRKDQWVGLRCHLPHHRQVKERNFLGWDIYPPGMLEVLRRIARYGRPIFITENGTCTADDAQRERFILRHLVSVARAIQEGIPVIGYLYWSLLDNFEWAQGYAPRFGLIEVDYATQARRIRQSASRFAEVCRSNRLTIPDHAFS